MMSVVSRQVLLTRIERAVAMLPKVLLLLTWALPAAMAPGAHSSEGVLAEADVAATMQHVLESLPQAARDTAARIPDPGRRLLAVRAYLRAGAGLQSRWSWTDAEAATFASSAEGELLQQAVAAVRCAFEAGNPGYTLYVNPEFRSLGVQLARWNANDTVGRAAAHLLAQARAASLQAKPDSRTANATVLRELLLRHVPQPVPTLAAPGLSPHGRGSAIDFQVYRADKLVAGPDSASVTQVWGRGGWSQRLSAAVDASGAPFEGPLRSPDEPWHYSFVPGPESVAPLATCPGSPTVVR